MELTVIAYPEDNYFHAIAEKLIEDNLLFYASQAAEEMEFENEDELEIAVKRAMELCISGGISIPMNFQRIYKSYPDGIHVDWKLSVLSYYLVKMNGDANNQHVAQLQIHLLKDQFLHQFHETTRTDS